VQAAARAKNCTFRSGLYALFQSCLDRGVGFASGQEDCAWIVHAQWGQIGQIELLAGQRKVNLANVLEIGKNGVTHRVECVLKRMAFVLSEGLQQHFSDCMPERAELRVFFRVKPIRCDDG